MSKKYGKLLLGAAILGAAAGAGLAYLSKYKKEKENWEDDFEDFEDDFEDDADAGEVNAATAAEREYVTIPKASEHETSEETPAAKETEAAQEGAAATETPVTDAGASKDTQDADEEAATAEETEEKAE